MILNIYKPKGWTSFDVVAKVRKLSGIKKVGHAGTLDPLAEGVLIVLTQHDTKKQDSFKDLTKEYEFDFVLGVSTPSGDLETVPEFVGFPNEALISNNLEQLGRKFIGDITQTAPIYSAKKVAGKRLYDIARSNHSEEKLANIELPQFPVTIYDLKLLTNRKTSIETDAGTKELTELSWKVKCSPGTYVRTLAQDLAKELNSTAVVTKLVRTAIGSYNIEDAQQIENLLFN